MVRGDSAAAGMWGIVVFAINELQRGRREGEALN
jgi:hypothetical protein